MSYCTEANLDTEFGPEAITLLADRDLDGVRDAGLIDRALAWADHLIDSKLAAALPLPLAAPYPPRLVDIAIDLSWYRLHRVPTDEARNRYEDAVRQLDAVRDGRENLGLDGAGEILADASPAANYEAPDRIFTEHALEGY